MAYIDTIIGGLFNEETPPPGDGVPSKTASQFPTFHTWTPQRFDPYTVSQHLSFNQTTKRKIP